MALRLALLGIIVLAAALLAEESAALLPTPQEQYTKAVQVASAAMTKLEAAVEDLRGTAHNATLQDRLVDSFLKAGGDKSTILRRVHVVARDKKYYVRGKAEGIARYIKNAVRVLKKNSKAAGEHEFVIEQAYQKSESVSERIEERAKQTGEEGANYAEAIFAAVVRKIKVRFAQAANIVEPAAASTAKLAVSAQFVPSAGAEPAPKKGETLSAGGPANSFNFGALVLVAIATAASAAAGTRTYLRRRFQDPFLFQMLG